MQNTVNSVRDYTCGTHTYASLKFSQFLADDNNHLTRSGIGSDWIRHSNLDVRGYA